jgi:hypothetical protein
MEPLITSQNSVNFGRYSRRISSKRKKRRRKTKRAKRNDKKG